MRVKASNAKSKPEAIPEHNDPYRIDWTEVKGKNYVVGVDVSRPRLAISKLISGPAHT
jgi:actin-related protein 8